MGNEKRKKRQGLNKKSIRIKKTVLGKISIKAGKQKTKQTALPKPLVRCDPERRPIGNVPCQHTIRGCVKTGMVS